MLTGTALAVALDGSRSAATDPTQPQVSRLSWGSATVSDVVSGVGDATAQRLTVHGRIPSEEMRRSGISSDTVIVTVSY